MQYTIIQNNTKYKKEKKKKKKKDTRLLKSFKKLKRKIYHILIEVEEF